jgi:4-alpha-glucanotransferase
MKIIQILPINDTTITRRWTDSYPYNAISIYALHPIYLGLNEFPLKDKKKFLEYRKKATELNALKAIDYEQVLILKENYIRVLFDEIGIKTLKSEGFKTFFDSNEMWLFPYACFTHFRDVNGTADFSVWKKFNRYNKSELENALVSDTAMKQSLELVYFTQYLLHTQLSAVKQYADKHEVILKGDVPIGISRNSVEAWVEPHLFNMNTQTGAPPDDFSIFGQNWGFPTYNWNEMAKNDYAWWTRRFQKMADYFDAYRIDHILGFFRIWEIPLHSVQGLLGYFSPALPFSVEELKNFDFTFDKTRMTKPFVHTDFLAEFFGEYTSEIIQKYLNRITFEQYKLKDFCDTQAKIKAHFEGKTDEKSNILRNGLYALCNEVLFVRDKNELQKFHPRITAQHTHSYHSLSDDEKTTYNRLYNHFFYERHNDFWASEAMKKLPALIDSTEMLVCGEDLGMIPDCVPAVMRELQILSLEIERMPKNPQQKFENLPTIPYMSVCTTSTHDMSPIRAWWLENRNLTQQYFNEILWKNGLAPEDCTPEICRQILMNHLNSPAMLAILPWQDWMSKSGKLRRKNPEEERINIPANPQHYWQYRMHLTLEDLLEQMELNEEIREMVEVSER